METSELTRRLNDWTNGDPQALDDIIPLVYQDLRRLAESRFNKERCGHTLQPTALVNEVYLRLTKQNLSKLQWEDRDHFLRLVSITMRRILIDSARKHKALKKGADRQAQPLTRSLDGMPSPTEMDAESVILLDMALDKLEQMDPRQTKIVHLHFFIGYTHKEISELMDMGERTVRREWAMAKAWLSRELASRSHL